jgi:hypothetical protein
MDDTDNRLAELINRGALDVPAKSFNKMQCFLEEYLRRAVRGSSRAILQGLAIVALAAAITWKFGGAHAWTVVVAAIAALVGLFSIAVNAALIYKRWRARYLSSFLTVHQHDRAMAGLSHSLERGLGLMLYLRDFSEEEEHTSYVISLSCCPFSF